MSPLGGSAEALWPKTFQHALEITCFKAPPQQQTPHIRMASHWACNMSPLGRAGAPALRAESAAPSARREHGVLDHRQTLPDLANSANSVRRSLEQGRARRQADPPDGPWMALDALPFSSWPRKSLLNRSLTILSGIFELILRIFSHLPLSFRWSSPILAYVGRILGHVEPNLWLLGPSLGFPMSLRPFIFLSLCF